MDKLGLLDKDTMVEPPHAELTEKLKSLTSPTPFHIAAEKAKELATELSISIPQLMMELVPIARSANIYVPVSEYIVGSCAMGKSGDLYLGMNLEFADMPLGQTVHSEQFSTANAIGHHETGLIALAVSSEPCGRCRQFLNEIQGGSDILVFIPEKAPITLAELLPRAFGPNDLGIETGLMAGRGEVVLMEHVPNELAMAALQAANYSYCPCSHCPAGVAIRLSDDTIYQGWYSENAAFNPSLPPLQMAVILAIADGKYPRDIKEAVLVEKEGVISQETNTQALLKALAPNANLEVLRCAK